MALYRDHGWHKLKVKLKKHNAETFNSIKTEMPFSIRKAANILHEHFIKFLGIQDLDEQTK